MNNQINVALIGFGEASKAFATGWPKNYNSLSAFDIKTDLPDQRSAMLAAYEKLGVSGCLSVDDAVHEADIIFSFVTADQAHDAACNVLDHIEPDALFFDCNSCAPDTKRRSAKVIEAKGGRYVDAAVMAPVHPNLHKTKVHICGDHTEAALTAAQLLEMDVTVMESDVGTASATKMIRSIMMKGLEAVMIECVLAGRRAGVDELVLDSLDETYPGFQFKQKAFYMMERVMVHGVRRAAEMREVALTVDQLGLDNLMSTSTVDWQELIGDLNLDPNYTLVDDDYQSRADIILAALDEV